MMPDAVLVQVPSIDFRTFIGLSHKVLGRSPAAPSDACRRDLSDAEREALQQRVAKLHAHWRPDGEYLAPPPSGTLAEIDPALRVTPPHGFEVGYVPIVTWQGMER